MDQNLNMKLIWSLLLCLAVPPVAFCQSTPRTQASLFFFHAGPDFRITPVNLQKQPGVYIPRVPVYYERDKQLNGLALNLGALFIHQPTKIGMDLSSSFRYDLIYFRENAAGLREEKKGLVSDIHLELLKFLPVKRNFIKLGLGFSFMNQGADYYYSEREVLAPGDTLIWESNSDFSFKS